MSDDAERMHEAPPRGYPPILLDTDYSAMPAASLSDWAEIAGGRLVLRGRGPNTIGGYPFSDVGYRDVIVDASIALAAGDEHDFAGIFLRQSSEQTYVALATSPTGYVYLATIADGVAQPVAEGPLTAGIPFNAGVGAWNRVTVVAFGPSLVFVLNGSVLVHLAVDQRYVQGYAGLFVQQGATSAEAKAAARWVQVRAVLADQK
jgi:hypothetical protein